MIRIGIYVCDVMVTIREQLLTCVLLHTHIMMAIWLTIRGVK